MSLVDRYLLSEVARVFGAIIATLLLVMVSMLLLRTLEQVNVGALNNDAVLRFLGLQILRDLASLLPPAFFIAVLVSLARLARDSELIAFAACGVGPVRLYRSLALFAVPLALLTAWFALVLQPYAAAEIQHIEDARNERTTQVAGLQAGRFYQQQDGTVTFYAGSLGKDRQFRDVMIQDRRSDPPRLVLSESASYRVVPGTGQQAVVLERGRRFDGQPGAADYNIAEFDRYTYFLDAPSEQVIERRRRSIMPTTALVGSRDLRDRAELSNRLALPLGVFTLALIAIPLTTISPRERGGGRLFLALLAYFAFFNLQRVAENWFASGVTPGWVGMLWYQAAIVLMVYGMLLPGSFWLRRLLAGNGAAESRAAGMTS